MLTCKQKYRILLKKTKYNKYNIYYNIEKNEINLHNTFINIIKSILKIFYKYENKTRKKITFNPLVNTIFIPSIKDYSKFNLIEELWYSKDEYISFKKNYYFEKIINVS